MAPLRAAADATKLYFRNPLNPASHYSLGRSIAASAELFQRVTKVYGKPSFGIETVLVGGERVPVTERIVWRRPFCNLIHFERSIPSPRYPSPKVLVVAPMSGHYATLLRGTVEALLPNFDVYITDWIDARMVPLSQGSFDLDDYIDYVISISHFLKGEAHVLAVCQPAVPVLAAAAVMDEDRDPLRPRSMTLMGGPIDTRINPTAVNELAQEKDLGWFRRNVIMTVPFPHPGFMRQVYPGFLQLSGFMSMNLDRHVTAHYDFYQHLVKGDGDSAEKHREFYNEYNAVMDLTAEFYLQTVDHVFIRHSLPTNTMQHRGRTVDLTKLSTIAMLTVEGEKDDISGPGQTEAAHDICINLPDHLRAHYLQPGVGHYGVFNGSRFRSEIAPRISDFIRTNDQAASSREAGATSAKPAAKSKTAPPKPKATPATKSAPEPVVPAPVVADDSGLSAIQLKVPKGAADDLTALKGVGPKLAEKLNELGIFHFRQIADLNAVQRVELDAQLSPPGRLERDGWVAQAKDLVNAPVE